jgi:hypothetical protein
MCVNLLVLENNDRVGVADSSLQQTLGILRAVWADDLQSGNASVPRRVILRVLGSDTGSETVGATEGDVAGLGTTGHVVRLCGGVDDLVNCLHGEVEGHELALSLLSDLPLKGDVSGGLTMGWRPASAAPTVRPAKPDSVMGESITLFSPKRSRRPFVTL